MLELTSFLLKYKNDSIKGGTGIMTIKLRDGIRVLIDKSKRYEAETFLEMFIGEPYFRHLPSELRKKINPVVLDIGANIGLFSLYSCSQLQKPKISAYEPDKNNFDKLQRNISENDLSEAIKAFNMAIAENGQMKFVAAEVGGTSMSEEIYKTQGRNSKSGKDEFTYVSSISILDVMKGIGHVDIFKMDCEGGEWKILEDLKGVQLDVNYFCVEWHSIGGKTRSDMAAFFTEKGYNVHLREMDNNSGSGILIAVKK